MQEPSHKYRFQKQNTSMNPQRDHPLSPLNKNSHDTGWWHQELPRLSGSVGSLWKLLWNQLPFQALTRSGIKIIKPYLWLCSICGQFWVLPCIDLESFSEESSQNRLSQNLYPHWSNALWVWTQISVYMASGPGNIFKARRGIHIHSISPSYPGSTRWTHSLFYSKSVLDTEAGIKGARTLAHLQLPFHSPA